MATDGRDSESAQPLTVGLNTLQNLALDKAGVLKKKGTYDKAGVLKKKGTYDHLAERSNINPE